MSPQDEPSLREANNDWLKYSSIIGFNIKKAAVDHNKITLGSLVINNFSQ